MRKLALIIMVLILNIFAQNPEKNDLRFDENKELTIIVDIENVKQSINGEIIGQIKKGTKIFLIERKGNWVNFSSANFNNAWIWAPSVGCKEINLCSANLYFEGENRNCKNIDYFVDIFGKPSSISKPGKDYKDLTYENLGDPKIKSITVSFNTNTGMVTEIFINFKNPINGLRTILSLAELPLYQPNVESLAAAEWVRMFKGLDKVACNRRDLGYDTFENLCFYKKVDYLDW
ncbi:MAG: hypothetical protein ABIJ40_05065 [Bacteroidota bacterium]